MVALFPFVALVLVAMPGPLSPLAVVKAADADVQKLIQSRQTTAEKLAAKADEFVDFAELARRALGKDWDTIKAKQRDEFSLTMKELLRASYAQKALADGQGGTSFEYGAESVEGNEATVASTLVAKTDRVPVVYKLYRRDAKAPWRIYDVVTDEVSLVGTYSDQFRQVISKKGFEGLLASLKARREQLEAGAPKRN